MLPHKKPLFFRARQVMPPSVWIPALVLATAAAVLAFLPLVGVLGYESSAVLSVLASVTASCSGIAQGWRRPAAWSPGTSAAAAVFGLEMRAITVATGQLLLPLGILLLNALRVKNCNMLEGLEWFLLLPVVTSVVWASVGLCWALFFKRRLPAALFTMATWLLVAIWNGYEFWAGPAMASYNQVAGWIAGPGVQDTIRPAIPLVASRAFGLLCAAAALVWVAATFDVMLNHCRLVLIAGRLRAAGVALCTTAAAAALFLAGGTVGFRYGWDAVEKKLDGTTETERFTIRHPSSWDEQRRALSACEHEFRLWQVERFFELQPGGRLRSYVFPSGNIKRELTGSGSVQFSKPWQRAIFINQSGFPHPVLRHELVHARLGEFGAWPLGIPARAWFWQNAALTEGIAVAVDWPERPFDPHRRTAAMMAAGLATDMERLLGLVGFWTHHAGRAYLQAGSFIRFVYDRYGPMPLLRAYRDGRLEGKLPVPLDVAIEQWRKQVEAIDLSPVELVSVRYHLGAPGLVERVCAHQVTEWKQRISWAIAEGRFAQAQEALSDWLGQLPRDPEAMWYQVRLLVEQDEKDRAAKLLGEILEQRLSPARRDDFASELADLLWKQGRAEEARKLWAELALRHPVEASRRLARAKLDASLHLPAGHPVLNYLIDPSASAGGLLRLREVAEQQPGWGLPWYLLGRALYNRGEYELALRYLQKSVDLGLYDSEVRAEAIRLQVICLFHLGLWRRAAVRLAAMSLYPGRLADPAWAADWFELLEFAQQQPSCAPRRPRERKFRDSGR